MPYFSAFLLNMHVFDCFLLLFLINIYLLIVIVCKSDFKMNKICRFNI